MVSKPNNQDFKSSCTVKHLTDLRFLFLHVGKDVGQGEEEALVQTDVELLHQQLEVPDKTRSL